MNWIFCYDYRSKAMTVCKPQDVICFASTADQQAVKSQMKWGD